MGIQSSYGLDQHGLTPTKTVHWNLSPAELIEAAIRRGEGQLTKDGPFLAITKPHTGRSPNDKYTVREASSEADIWWGNNQALSEAQFDELHRRALAYLNEREMFVRDVFACADPAYRLRVRLVDEVAWTNLFANNLFIRPEAERPERLQAGLHHFARAGNEGQSGDGSDAHGDRGRAELREENHLDHRHTLCR